MASAETMSGVDSCEIWEDGGSTADGSDDGKFVLAFATALLFAPCEHLLVPAILYQHTCVIGQNQ